MKKQIYGLILLIVSILFFTSCDINPTDPVSSSGVQKATTTVQTDANGHTTEQNNIINRYKVDNTPGSIKHLYVISAYSGQVLIYSTVRGKVTSSGKRLTPNTVDPGSGMSSNPKSSNDGNWWNDNRVNIGNNNYRTSEVIQDDGTYGISVEYIYWFDTRGVYHQQYITGGMILHVSDQPLAVKNIILNMELTGNEN